MTGQAIDLRTCKPGDKLLSCHGMILTYKGPSGNKKWPHLVEYPDGSDGTRTDDGFVISNPKMQLPRDHNIVKILGQDIKAVIL